MKKICFAIPTWNRSQKLNTCVESIAEQIIQSNISASIFISDNCSDDETDLVISNLKKKYNFIESNRRKTHGGAFENLSDVSQFANGDYVWWFGDDDKLLPGGLKLVCDQLDQGNFSIISAGNGWFTPHTGRLTTGTVFELCNYMGWNQFIGWISSVVMKKEIARKVGQLMLTKPYIDDAYAHVGALLKLASNLQGAHLDTSIAQPIEATTEVDAERWSKEDINWRFFLTIDTFEHLINANIIPQKLNPNFFKYIDKYFWDLLLFNMITTIDPNSPYRQSGWSKILSMSNMINDFDIQKNIKSRCLGARSMTHEFIHCKRKIDEIDKHLGIMLEDLTRPFLSKGIPYIDMAE